MTFDIIREEMKKALKNKDKFRKEVIAELVGEIKNTAILLKLDRENISEDVVNTTALQEYRKAKEMIETCPLDRQDKIKEYIKRREILEEFIPTQMSEDEIRAELFDFCKYKNIELKKENRIIIMKNFMPTIKGRADGKLANKIISESLT